VNSDFVLLEADGWHVAISLTLDIASQGNSPEESMENLIEAMALLRQWPGSMARQLTAKQLTTTIPKSTFRQVRFKLENAGFDEVRQLGNHAMFVKREVDAMSAAILPHYIELAGPVVASIVRQSGIALEEFFQIL
jgi:predicted RNA binding protein YcfA (HicA-like mRNA interferase family)